MKRQSLAWWPIPKYSLALVMLIMALGSFLSSLQIMRGDYQLWAQTNRFIHDSLWISGSLLAGMAALVATMLMPRGSIFAANLGRRSFAQTLARQLGALIAAAFVGHCLGAVPLLILTASNASGGYLSWASVCTALSGIITLTSIGFALGTLVKSYYIAPLAALLVFCVMGAIAEPVARPLALIFPVHHVYGSARFTTNPFVAVFSLLFAGVLLLCVLMLFASKSPFKHALTTPNALVPLVCVVALIGCAFWWRPELLTVQRPVITSCAPVGETQICLHEEIYLPVNLL